MQRSPLILAAFAAAIALAASCEQPVHNVAPPPAVFYEQNFDAIATGDEPADWNEFYHMTGYTHPSVTAGKAMYFNVNTMSYGYLASGAEAWGDIQLDFDVKFDVTTDDPLLPVCLRIVPFDGASAGSATFMVLNIFFDEEDADSYGAYGLISDSTTTATTQDQIVPFKSDVSGLSMVTGQAYHVRITLVGNRIRAYYDNASSPFFDFTFADLTAKHPSGCIGFMRLNHNYELDNLVVTDL